MTIILSNAFEHHFDQLITGHSNEKERRITGKNLEFAFFCGAFAGKNFYRHFCLFFTRKVEFDKKNTQKYIVDVKFPTESNPAGRIGLNIEERPEK